MKITKEHVGKKVSHEGWEKSSWLEVLYICPSNDFFLGLNQEGKEDLWPTGTSLNYLWKLYHEPFMIDGKEVKVGDKIRVKGWDKNEFLIFQKEVDCKIFGSFVGKLYKKLYFIGAELDWEFYQEPKPKKLVAPALVKVAQSNGANLCRTSDIFYSSEEEARYQCGFNFISWPAVPNAQGFYEVPE